MRSAFRTALLLLPLASAVAACGGSGNVTLSARAGAPLSPSRGLFADDRQNLTSGGVTITRIRGCLREVKFENEEAGGVEEIEYKTAASVLELSGSALDGAVQNVLVADVPAGTYESIKFKIHKPSDGESTDPAVKAMAAADASFIVEGTIGGAPFTFVTAQEAEQEFEGRFVIGEGSDNVTLNLDATTWFQGSGGVTLDPRDGQNRSAIEERIKRSFRLYEDDDRDGDDD